MGYTNLGDQIPKRDNYRGEIAGDPAELRDGDWWYNTDENVCKWYIRGSTRRIGAYVEYAEEEFTVPVGGGAVHGTITISGLTIIENLIAVTVRWARPPTHAVYTPQAFFIAGNVVGITCGAVSGTTLNIRATAYGYRGVT